MKVLLINGSPRKKGNTDLALSEIAKTLTECGVDSEIVWIGNHAMQGCIACYRCKGLGHCIFRDAQTMDFEKKFDECDGIVIGSPVYYAGPTGSLCALMDRMFMSYGQHLAYKPAAAVAVGRRGGLSATFDRLNKYFTINNMPVVSSQYWNMAYGTAPGEVSQDAEGLQTMRTLARNMAWLLKSLKDNPHPEREPWTPTNFIR